MQEVLIVSPSSTEEELQIHRTHARMNTPIGVIITEPRHEKIAREFDSDIVPMFNEPEEALLVAQQISEASGSLVVVIGEPIVNTAG